MSTVEKKTKVLYAMALNGLANATGKKLNANSVIGDCAISFGSVTGNNLVMHIKNYSATTLRIYPLLQDIETYENMGDIIQYDATQCKTASATSSGVIAIPVTNDFIKNGVYINNSGNTTLKFWSSEDNYISYLTYDVPKADLSNFAVTQTSSGIKCTWQSTDQTSYTVNAKADTTVKSTKSGTTQKTCEFTYAELGGEGTYTLELTANEVTTPLTATIEVKYAEISNFSISGTSIDSNIVCTWSATDQTNYTINAKLNGVVKSTKSGTTATTCTFPIGTFTQGGTYTFELTANGVTAPLTQEVVLTYSQATISLLELPGSTVNVDEVFTITWVSSNQTRFTLLVGDKTYTGTTQKSVTVPKNAIGKGTINVSLTVYFANQYYSNSATASSSFVGYGKPSAPTLNISSSYSSATPSLSWSSDEQTAYRVVIKQALTTIEDSNDTVSTNSYYVPTTALSNNTTYTVSVKVKNKYNLWSDEGTATFMIQFTVPSAPTIQAISDTSTGSIIVTVATTTTDGTEYKNTEIWKREPGEEWKRMAYKLKATDIWQDFYVAGNVEYEYKARNIGKSGGIAESGIITAQTVVNGYNFYDVEDNSNFMRFTTGEAPKPKINQPHITQNLFANASAPTTFGDGTLYWSCTMQFSLSNREETYKLYKLLQAKLLLYKDNKGHKWFGNIVNSPDFLEDDVEIITVTLEFTQAQFAEEDVYCGDNLELITWNGGWKFDGTHVFGGE